jgi:hypothetical protein
VQDLHARLNKLTATISAASADSARASSLTRLQENKAKLLEDLAVESRTLEWHQSVAVHGGWKSIAISQLSLFLAALLRRIQASAPNVWAYVPEIYVECAVCSFHALQRTQNTALMPTTVHVASLLSRLLGDNRLVSPNMRDVVLQSVTNLLSSTGTLSAIADNDDIMNALLPGLMERYTQVGCFFQDSLETTPQVVWLPLCCFSCTVCLHVRSSQFCCAGPLDKPLADVPTCNRPRLAPVG